MYPNKIDEKLQAYILFVKLWLMINDDSTSSNIYYILQIV
jgi:hypothetical protein